MGGIDHYHHLTVKVHPVLCEAVKLTSVRQGSFLYSIKLKKHLYNDGVGDCLFFSITGIGIMARIIDHVSLRKRKKK